MLENEILADKISQGVMLLSAAKYESAKELFEELIKEAPKEKELYIHLGNTYTNLEMYEDAIESFKKVLMLDSNNGEAYFSIGSIYILQNEFLKAVESFNKAESLGYISSDMYYIMATLFLNQGDEIQALRNISKAINVKPLDGKLRLFKAKVNLSYGRLDQALATLDEMEAVLPDAFEAYDLRSQIYLGVEEYQKALEVINKGCVRFPQDTNLATSKLKVLVRTQQNEEAERWLKYMQDNSLYEANIKEASLIASELLLSQGKYEEGLKLLIDANETVGNDYDLLFIICGIISKSGNIPEFLEYSKRLEAIEAPDFYKAAGMSFYATALDASGNNEEAVKIYKKITSTVRKMTINDPAFYEGYLYRIVAHTKLKEFDKAKELADYVENIFPDKADSHAFRSFIYKEMGDEKAAEEEKKLAKAIDPAFTI